MDEHAADPPIRIFPSDWDPIDAGFVMLSNYWKRFWWPLLGHPAAPLYELLLSYTSPQSARCWPSLRSLAETLGVDVRALTGRELKGVEYPGAIERLQQAALVAVESDASHGRNNRQVFWVRQRPPLLTDEQVAGLIPTLRAAHERWIAANTNPNQNMRSMVSTITPRRRKNKRSMVSTYGASVATHRPLVPTTRTIPINKTQEQNDVGGSQKTEAADPHARLGWEAIRDELMPQLSRYQRQTYATLTPISDRGRALILRATTTYTAEQWRAGDVAERIRRLWPYPLDTVAILGPGEVYPSAEHAEHADGEEETRDRHAHPPAE